MAPEVAWHLEAVAILDISLQINCAFQVLGIHPSCDIQPLSFFSEAALYKIFVHLIDWSRKRDFHPLIFTKSKSLTARSHLIFMNEPASTYIAPPSYACAVLPKEVFDLHPLSASYSHPISTLRSKHSYIEFLPPFARSLV